MRNLSTTSILFLSFLAILSIQSFSSARSNNFSESHADLVKGTPEGLSLTLKLPKKTFAQGEIIPVTFIFRNTSEVKYQVWTGTYDRSGRFFNIEFFVDDPTGGAVTDPLCSYFTTRFYIGGGLGGYKELGKHCVDFEMNEWVRFDKPGGYRFYATSTRVSRTEDYEYVTVVSPIMEIEIIPNTRRLSSRLLRQAETMLGSDEDETQAKGSRILRFLGTRKSIESLIPLLGHPNGSVAHNAYFGIIGCNDWSFACKELVRKLVHPDVCVDELYVDALAHISIPSEEYHSAKEEYDTFISRMAQVPSYEKSRELHLKEWERLGKQYTEFCERISEERERIKKDYLKLLKRNILAKKGYALAVSCELLLDNEIEFESAIEVMAKAFSFIDEYEKAAWLKDRWDSFKCPEFEPILQKIINEDFVSEYWEGDGLYSIALKRYHELNPEEARKVILRDIRRRHPRYSRVALFCLPDKSLPEFDEVFEKHLNRECDTSKIVPLIERYATGKILPEVIKFYQESEGRWDCSGQESLLRYWMKHDRKNGLIAVAKAVGLREHTGCYRSVLGNVLSDYYGPDAEKTTISFLDDVEPDVVVDAVRLLKRKGNANCIDPLLAKLSTIGSDDDKQKSEGAVFSQGNIRSEILKCLMECDRWQLTEKQKQSLEKYLRTEKEWAAYKKRFQVE